MSDIDAEIRAHLEAGEVDLAAARAIEHYGPELHGFLRALARDEGLASDAFSLGCEALWRSLPTFRWESSLRTWAYSVVRRALHRVRSDPRRRPERNLPVSLLTSIANVERSATAPFQRTDVKDALRALREALDPLDHEILILRLDRMMSWKDIARSIAAEDEGEPGVDQRAAALRKRFERAKDQLRELAIERGLLASDGD